VGVELTDDECRKALEVAARHPTKKSAAEELGIPPTTFNTRLEIAKRRGLDAKDAPPPPDVSKGMPFERAWTEIQRFIGMAKDRYSGPPRAKAKTGRLKVVAAGDFHIPFHHRGALARLIQQDGDADVLVIGGDFGDAHCASTFTKYEHVPFHEEFAGQAAVLQTLSETFPTIKYLRGSNHSDRYEKRIRESLDKDVLDAVLEMTGGLLAPDLALVKRFPNVELLDMQTPSGMVSWLGAVGDVLFSHAEKYSRVPGSALRSVDEWIDDQRGHLGIDNYRAVIQFHTHAAAMLPWRADRLLVEPGCMCQVHSYQLGSRIAGRPQRLGYVVMEIVDGHLDVNSVRLRFLDAETKAA
jgi:hypothetical protein